MKIPNKIRQKVSQYLEILIPEGQWEQYVDMLDRDGKFTSKNMMAILLIACRQIETLETIVEDLSYQLDLLQNRPAVKSSPDVKLRTGNDIKVDLDTEWQNNRNLTCFHLTKEDWKILEKNIDPSLAKMNADFGYGREINPDTKREEVCLYYRERPVFKDA